MDLPPGPQHGYPTGPPTVWPRSPLDAPPLWARVSCPVLLGKHTADKERPTLASADSVSLFSTRLGPQRMNCALARSIAMDLEEDEDGSRSSTTKLNSQGRCLSHRRPSLHARTPTSSVCHETAEAGANNANTMRDTPMLPSDDPCDATKRLPSHLRPPSRRRACHVFRARRPQRRARATSWNGRNPATRATKSMNAELRLHAKLALCARFARPSQGEISCRTSLPTLCEPRNKHHLPELEAQGVCPRCVHTNGVSDPMNPSLKGGGAERLRTA